jgi:hypothetical protein
MDEKTRQRQIEEHLEAIRRLQAPEEPEKRSASQSWPPAGYYLVWNLLLGLGLGAGAALVSLAANIASAPLFGKRPLELIRVYLTFPMGDRALSADDGFVLFVGCALYLVTGGLYGIVFHLLMSTRFADSPPRTRFLVASAIGLGLWVANFYLVLSWLQPALLGDNWIVRLIPFWVGALTHLAFGWTMLLGESWSGRFEPYRAGAEARS